MRILRTIFGIILILIAVFLTGGFFFSIPIQVRNIPDFGTNDTSNTIGYFVGTTIGLGLTFFIIFLCFRYGIKMLKKKAVLTEENQEQY